MNRTRKLYARIAGAALAAAAIFGAGIALAAVTTVRLGPNGPQPATVTVQWGDTVAFQNGGDRAIGVTIPRIAVSSPVIQPGSSWSRVFDGRSGNYLFRQTEGRGFPGTVVVELKGSVTMTATPETVLHGKRVTLAGTALANHAVKIEQLVAAAAGQWADVVTVQAGADGKWTTSFVPKRGTRFRATAAAGQLRSPAVSVLIQPLSSLARPSGLKVGSVATVRGRVVPAGAATAADLERFDAERRRWVQVDRRAVSKAGAVSFRWKVAKGRSQLRLQLHRYALAQGFAAGASKPITVTAR